MSSGDDLCFQTATEVIAAFKARTLSPVELMDAIIDRCERVNPQISAFTYTFFDRGAGAGEGGREGLRGRHCAGARRRALRDQGPASGRGRDHHLGLQGL